MFFNPTGSQFGLINISLGQSSEPKVEEEVLADVGTYGKQLGRIGDALTVLLAHFHPSKPLTADETKAIDALNDMLRQIAAIKAEAPPAGDAPRRQRRRAGVGARLMPSSTAQRAKAGSPQVGPARLIPTANAPFAAFK